MKRLNLIKRYFYFFYYTKKTQIFNRLISKIKRPISHKFISSRRVRVSEPYNYFVIDSLSTYDKLSEILDDKFTFLEKTIQFGKSISWSSKSADDLWNFHLNYFDYLTDFLHEFKKTSDVRYIKKGQALIEDWVNNSNEYNKITWAPYTISLRLLNWISFYSYLIKNNQIKNIPTHIIESIKQQKNYLKSNFEYDVLGNHLFENIKTIILVEYFFNNTLLTQKYVYKLNIILSKQILEDGCHFEKSISYHLVVMNGIVQVLDILKFTDINTKSLYKYAKLMYDFYNHIEYSSSDYPLFNDSNFSMTERIMDINKKKNLILNNINDDMSVETLKKSSGYFVYKNNLVRLTMDLGDFGSNYLLAHAHNDIFNFELLYGKKKFVVDTGVYEYEMSEKRKYSRSTSAHNTVQVSNIEQSDIWGSFRIAYRPQGVQGTFFSKDTYSKYFGSYKYRRKYTHNRSFIITKKDTIVINDNIISKFNYNYKSFLHLHPDVLVTDCKDCLELQNMEIKMYLYAFSNYSLLSADKLERLITKYYPHFGIEVNRQTVINKNSSKNQGFIFSPTKIKRISFVNNELLILYANGIEEKMELKK